MGKHNVTVLDIGQAEIHDMISLGMLIEAPAEPGLRHVLRGVRAWVCRCGYNGADPPQS
jgi:predicted amino acid-binding ACT domain protein